MFYQQFFTHLAKDGITVPKRYKEEIIQKINALNYIPRIGIFGKTGAGKSSLCNALYGEDICKVSDVEACTRNIQEIFINIGEKGIRITDMPGAGESEERDNEYIKLYSFLLPEFDLILWVLKGDDRAFSSDQMFYKNIVKPHLRNGAPFFIVLNQVDKIEPFREWDYESRQPSPKQSKSIEEKCRLVAGFFEFPVSRVIAVSANEKFGLVDLVDQISGILPKRKIVYYE